jgi:hypothetical protein
MLLIVLVVVLGLMLRKSDRYLEQKNVSYIPAADTATVGENTTEVSDASRVSESAQGYVTKAYICGGTPCIDIDYINWLTGKDAEDYCALKGNPYCAPNGFVIQNDNPKIRTFSFSPDASIMYISRQEEGQSPKNISITPQQFLDIYNGVTPPPEPAYSFGKGNKLFGIKVDNGKITSLAESYTP